MTPAAIPAQAQQERSASAASVGTVNAVASTLVTTGMSTATLPGATHHSPTLAVPRRPAGTARY